METENLKLSKELARIEQEISVVTKNAKSFHWGVFIVQKTENTQNGIYTSREK